MQLFTALAGNQPILTLNADNEQEAKEALSTLLGEVGELTIRTASSDEGDCWRASAMDACIKDRPLGATRLGGGSRPLYVADRLGR